MVPWLVAGILGWKWLDGNSAAKAPAVMAPIDLECPVDPQAPLEIKGVVQSCFLQGTPEDMRGLAGALGQDFPIARNSLVARAYAVEQALAFAKRVEEDKRRAAEASAQPPPPVAAAPPVTGSVPQTKPTAEDLRAVRLAENKAAIDMATKSNGAISGPLVLDNGTPVAGAPAPSP